MRPLKTFRRVFTATPLLVVALLSSACGWKRTMLFQSPSNLASIEILQTRLDNSWGVRLELVASGRRTVLLEKRREAFVNFVHVYWSQDESKAAVLLTGLMIRELAFEVPTGRPIEFGILRDDLARSIRDTYHLPPQEDPIGWASMSDGHAAFFRLHPEIQVSYH